MPKSRPPVAIEVLDLLNLARLAMSMTDIQPLLWLFEHKGALILGSLLSIPYWRGGLPIFAYAQAPDDVRGACYLAYTSMEHEEALLTRSTDSSRYVYGPIIEVESPPEPFIEALSSKQAPRPMPIPARARSISSLLRALVTLSDEAYSPPIWHYEAGEGKHILGVITPLYDYYDADALPIFLYVEVKEEPGPFIRYLALNGEEIIEYSSSISTPKYFYGRVVTVKQMPFLRSFNDQR
ncbi:MAG: hypothetical protein QXO04_03835 [Nitrososphaerota archaeon]